MDEIHFPAQLRQIGGVLQRGVSAAAYSDNLIFIERTVAHCTETFAVALILLLFRETQRLGSGTGCDYDRSSLVFLIKIRSDSKQVSFFFQCDHFAHLGLCTQFQRAVGHKITQIRPADGSHGREVFHQRRPGDLSSEGILFYYKNALSCSFYIDSSGEPCRSPANHNYIINHKVPPFSVRTVQFLKKVSLRLMPKGYLSLLFL